VGDYHQDAAGEPPGADADVTATRFKPGSLLTNGYVQFHVPGSLAPGQRSNGCPDPGDPHSLHIRKGSNGEAEKLVSAVERARI